jgi:uncharacterized protein
MIALLDINVLLARLDKNHSNHSPVRDWFLGQSIDGLLTCPLSENGFLRIFSNPAYPSGPGDMAGSVSMLRRFRNFPGHRFVGDDFSILSGEIEIESATPSQLTDLYLLALAVRHDAKFVTLDTRIDPARVKGGTAALVVIPI